MSEKNIMRLIPRVDTLMESEYISSLCADIPRAVLKNLVREYLDELRKEILAGNISEIPQDSEILKNVAEKVRRASVRNLRKVVNASGVVLHTNLGRAPLGELIGRRVIETVSGYCNLEYDIEKGKRSYRNLHIEELICSITGAEAAVAVNNNASAVFLVLNELASGKKVAISRGELVEIGGSFRVPDIMSASGAELIEVGTTNKTRISDYVRAIEKQGAEVLLKVHTSNFKIEGFTESVSVGELAEAAETHGCTVIYDLGAGFLVDRELAGIHEGENIKKSLADGADIIMFSGDKLMGSVQAGIIAGKRELIDKMRNNSLMRMLRPDKIQLAVLEETLRHYLDPQDAVKNIPVLNMFAKTREALMKEAEELAAVLSGIGCGCSFEAVETEDVPGGGSLPGTSLKGAAVSVVSEEMSAAALEQALRENEVPVIAKICDDRLLLSVRTLIDDDSDIVADAFRRLADKRKNK